jgi:selenocysteine-specific translation elongation factor
MIDYLFPIFGFGVVVTGIVFKGLLLARDTAEAQAASEGQSHAEFDDDQIRSGSAPVLSRSTPIGNDRAKSVLISS